MRDIFPWNQQQKDNDMEITMNKNLTEIVTLMQGDPSLRDKVNLYLGHKVHADLDSIQQIASDDDGDYLPEPEDGWPSDPVVLEAAIDSAKDKVYADVLAHLKAKDEPVVTPDEDEDEEELTPEPPKVEKPKAKKKRPTRKEREAKIRAGLGLETEQVVDIDSPDPLPNVANAPSKQAALDLLFGDKGLDEDRVREIVREEIKAVLKKIGGAL